MIYIVDGKVDMTIFGKVYGLKKGEMTIEPANHPHSLKAAEEFKMALVMISSKQ